MKHLLFIFIINNLSYVIYEHYRQYCMIEVCPLGRRIIGFSTLVVIGLSSYEVFHGLMWFYHYMTFT